VLVKKHVKCNAIINRTFSKSGTKFLLRSIYIKRHFSKLLYTYGKKTTKFGRETTKTKADLRFFPTNVVKPNIEICKYDNYFLIYYLTETARKLSCGKNMKHDFCALKLVFDLIT
jgi:hypothetical protein